MNTETPKQRILIFIDWFLPGYKAGGPVRSMANMVEYLKEDYAFYIVTRNTDYTESTPYTTVKSNCWESFAENVKVFYADKALQNKASFNKLMDEIQPDIVYINGVYSWKFSILPLVVAKKAQRPKVIVAARGMLAQSAIDVKGEKKRLFLKAARMAGLYKNVVFHATNQKEEQDIIGVLGKKCRVQVADNLPKKVLPELKSLEKKQGYLKLVSLARIAPEKNTLFALERLAELNDFEGTIQFDLYGQIYSDAYWKLCQEMISVLPSNIRVEHKGTVDAELVGETIQNYHALFMPTRGENFGHVILESLSSARPVLISDQTPWRDLVEVKAGWDVSLKMEDGRQKTEVSGETPITIGGEESPKTEDRGRKTEEKLPELALSSSSLSGVEGDAGVKTRWSRRKSEKDYQNNGWCSVLGALVEMEQQEFNSWCEGARKRAEGFVNNAELKAQYNSLFG